MAVTRGGGEGRSRDLHEIGVAVETKEPAACGGDALRVPARFLENHDGGLADSLKTSETVADLGFHLGFGGFGRVGEDEVNGDASFLRDAGDAGAGCVRVGGDGGVENEAEVDDIAGEIGVVAVAESTEEVGFGEHPVC